MTISEYSRYKRMLEWYIADPEFREKADADPTEAVKLLGYENVISSPSEALEAIKTTIFSGIDISSDNRYMKAYYEVYAEISENIQGLHSSLFADERIGRFAEITRMRCSTENMLIRSNRNILYFPICFELSEGCRMNCDFCGLSAERFSGFAEYSEKNRELWRGVLKASRSVIGDISGICPMYFATEPFDSPDYMKFLSDCKEIFGFLPQTTTAAADVYPEKIRELMRFVGSDELKNKALLRISVRNIKQFKRITEIFSPEEIAFVELCINNRESVNRYSDSGRTKNITDISEIKKYPYSICCVSGIKVNMLSKTIAFITPEIPSEKYPKGYRIWEEDTFGSAAEYEEKIKNMFGKYALTHIPSDQPLAINDSVGIKYGDGKIYLVGDGIKINLPDNDRYRNLISCLNKNLSYNELTQFDSFYSDAAWYNLLDMLYCKGYVRLY